MQVRKYGNKWTKYKGILYASQMEASYAKYLDKEKKASRVRKWDRQIPFPLTVAGQKITTYIIDFYVEDYFGVEKYVEIKGMQTDVWKLKLKLFKALYPTVRYEVLFSKDLRAIIPPTRRKR